MDGDTICNSFCMIPFDWLSLNCKYCRLWRLKEAIDGMINILLSIEQPIKKHMGGIDFNSPI